MKSDSDKSSRLELIPAPFLWELGKLFATGARKYADENWRKSRDSQRYSGALLRHFMAWKMGEQRDPETGIHHLVCVALNACTLFVLETEFPGEIIIGPDSCTKYAGRDS